MVAQYSFYCVLSHLRKWREKKTNVVWLYKFLQITWMVFTIYNKIKEKSEQSGGKLTELLLKTQ